MRLIGKFQDIALGQRFSQFLLQQGVENQLEITVNRDWGSPQYGDQTCQVWVVDEDAVDSAQSWLEKFEENPNDEQFQVSKPLSLALEQILHANQDPEASEDERSAANVPEESSAVAANSQPLGPWTAAIFLICALLWLISELTTPAITEPIPPFPPTPLYTAPVKKKLLYDYPNTYILIDKLVSLYGIEKIREPQELPIEGQRLTLKIYNTPYWQGIYPDLIQHWRNPKEPWKFDAPLFERIRQGEFWRLWTPILLHSDIIHLIFNMIWLLILGRQMEQRLGGKVYLLFIAISALISNTLQYLMSGANFIGFSGVLCAMLTFIWMRQRHAAWEGYQLQTSTLVFMMIFILAMGGIQFISFFSEAYANYTLSPGIANTAHLTGAAVGIVLGKMNFFAERNR